MAFFHTHCLRQTCLKRRVSVVKGPFGIILSSSFSAHFLRGAKKDFSIFSPFLVDSTKKSSLVTSKKDTFCGQEGSLLVSPTNILHSLQKQFYKESTFFPAFSHMIHSSPFFCVCEVCYFFRCLNAPPPPPSFLSEK